MHIFRYITVISLLLLALTACSGAEEPTGDKAQGPDLKASAPVETAGSPAAGSGDILDLDADGLADYLAANRGKPTLIMLWATWCPSCKQQIPEMEQLQKTRGDQVNVIALSVDENRKALQRYLDKKPMELTVAWGDQQIARDHNVEAIPTLLIFDKSGKKIFGQPGVFPASMLGAMADKLVSE